MKIAIIGCGYVGKAIASYWYQQGHQLTVTTTTEEKAPNLKLLANQVIIMQGNDLDKMRQVCLGQDIILLSVGAMSRDPSIYQRTYLETAKTLVTALASNSTVQQVIYTGTYSIFGDQGGIWADETSAIAPLNENGKILAQTEQILLNASNPSCKICILRLAGIYGEKRQIVDIFRPIFGKTRPGNGENYVNWIHLEDIVSAIEFVRNHQLEGIYHVASDQPMITRELLTQLAQFYQLPAVTWDNNTNTPNFNVRLSSQKLKNLGYKLKYPQLIL